MVFIEQFKSFFGLLGGLFLFLVFTVFLYREVIYFSIGIMMKYILAISIFLFTGIPSNIFASSKKITILVHGTGAGYKVRLGKSVRYCPEGLTHLKPGIDAGSYYFTKQKALSQDITRFDEDHFYVFGWSGKLGFNVRKQAGKRLAEQLSQLIYSYKEKYAVYPHIRIITFSHGGNVALQIAEFADLLPKELSTELIMFGSPIQASTEQFIYSGCFKKVYNIFSNNDVVQRIDPQNLYAPVKDTKSFFSRRTISKPTLLCKQAKITIKGKGLCHLDMMHGLSPYTSYILDILDAHHLQDVCSIDLDVENYIHFRGYNMMRWLRAHCV